MIKTDTKVFYCLLENIENFLKDNVSAMDCGLLDARSAGLMLMGPVYHKLRKKSLKRFLTVKSQIEADFKRNPIPYDNIVPGFDALLKKYKVMNKTGFFN